MVFAGHRSTVLIVFISLLATGCGYIGEPLYPALKIPNRVTDLSVVERADRLDVNFTIPDLTTEGLAVKSIGEIDLRVGPAPAPNFTSDQWAASATKIEVKSPDKPQAVHAQIAVKDYVGKEVIVAVRIGNTKNRFSEWSNRATINVAPPVLNPTDFTATPVPQGVLLKWNAASGTQFKIYRDSDKEPQPTLLATVPEHEYIDSATSYGIKYEYFIQATIADVESDAVGPQTVTPKDVFPPAVPAGLTVTTGLNAIELAWERNIEPDFKSYRVYRALNDGNWAKIADDVASPNYSDQKIESGKRYRYAITAVDQLGNESEKCTPVEIAAP